MNRKSFMAELRSLLAFLDAAERDRVLNRYERMFDEAGLEGETTVVRCFGSPVRQVLQIEREYREAVASGETPFADGEAAGPEEAEAPEETVISKKNTPVYIYSPKRPSRRQKNLCRKNFPKSLSKSSRKSCCRSPSRKKRSPRSRSLPCCRRSILTSWTFRISA